MLLKAGTRCERARRWVRRPLGGGAGGHHVSSLSTFLFISLLLSPQWRVRRIYWNRITETSGSHTLAVQSLDGGEGGSRVDRTRKAQTLNTFGLKNQ